ncbi:cytochrome b561 [Cupriavidus sp. YR651]|uniref:cytochrome b n=1 Tax=Cupriavidus sp. YR651 TaxID=1855315 RepID=UPI000884A8ED|nr:cytochrome b [Cupriavidus sp. YR651]SDC89172.1 cytochrome b561 [Cupriavidus sp. YR651]
MSAAPQSFSIPSRILHWLMAPLILAMLFIGVGMVATVSDRYALLVSIHKPLGVAILALVAIRLVVRLARRPPPLPVALPPIQRLAARASHMLLYLLMFAMPLIGWGMLSAAGYPIVLGQHVQLPAILPHNAYLYATLRQAHTVCAFLLFAIVLLHIAAALHHRLIRRDGVFDAMTSGEQGR